MKKPVRIILTQRKTGTGHDYHACVEGNSAAWDCGATPSQAIGNLVRSNWDVLGLEVAFVVSKEGA